jgi:hypothetical protein
MAGVTVRAIPTRRPEQPSALNLVTAVSDDRGAYRLYGLMPGEYLIVATQSVTGSGALVMPSTEQTDAMLAALAQRQRRATASATVSPEATPRGRSVGASPIYFPGTAYLPEAERLRLEPGEERTQLDFEVGFVPVTTISGTIAGAAVDLSRLEITITHQGPRITDVAATMGITSSPVTAAGEFSYGNVPPGRYRIIARARSADPDAPPPLMPAPARGGGAGRSGTPTPGLPTAFFGDQLFAAVDVDVRGQPISGLVLSLQPGGSMAGRVQFAGASAPSASELANVRVSLEQTGDTFTAMSAGTWSGTALTTLQAVALGSDGTFRIRGIGPAGYRLRVILPAALSRTWHLRSAMADDRDLLDGVIEGPAVQLDGVTITLSDQRTDLTGTLQSSSGTPAPEYIVVAISADRAHWVEGSRRSLFTRPDTTGRFTFSNVPAGDYVIAALTGLDPGAWEDAVFLDQIAASGVRVTVREGQVTTQNLQIR